MKEPIPFSRPDVTGDEIREVVAVLESGWITTGPKTHHFEEEFARAVGARFALALNSCTAALHLALEALGVGPGDEVILPTLTFAASGEVVRYLGAIPVLVDADPLDHNIDPAAVEKALTPRTKVVMAVDFGGQACRLDQLLTLTRSPGIHLVEDAAHAFPASLEGRAIGSISDITCFSFYATKPLTTGEGGMATTDNERWAERMRVMSLHGISKDAWKRYAFEGSWHYEIVAPGYKYNMTDIAAAMGLVQLRRAGEMLARRREIARRYREALADDGAFELLSCRSPDEHAWHLFVIKLRDEALTIQRDRFVTELKAAGIGTSVHFIPLHLHPYYRQTFGYRAEDFPVATELSQRSLSLPIYSRMTDAEVTRVIEEVRKVARRFRR